MFFGFGSKHHEAWLENWGAGAPTFGMILDGYTTPVVAAPKLVSIVGIDFKYGNLLLVFEWV